MPWVVKSITASLASLAGGFKACTRPSDFSVWYVVQQDVGLTQETSSALAPRGATVLKGMGSLGTELTLQIILHGLSTAQLPTHAEEQLFSSVQLP